MTLAAWRPEAFVRSNRRELARPGSGHSSCWVVAKTDLGGERVRSDRDARVPCDPKGEAGLQILAPVYGNRDDSAPPGLE